MKKIELHLPEGTEEYEGDIRFFMDTMLRKLSANRFKGWATKNDVARMLAEMVKETEELVDALASEGQFEALMESVDVANMALLCGIAISKQTRADFDSSRGYFIGAEEEAPESSEGQFEAPRAGVNYRWMRRLRFVPRWAVVPTLRQQNVAEHCFHVLWVFDWMRARGWVCPKVTAGFEQAMQVLGHDQDEAVTGDIPAPSKNSGASRQPDHVRTMLKIADNLEAALTLREEQSMGNGAIEPILIDVLERGEKWTETARQSGWAVPTFASMLAGLWEEVRIERHPSLGYNGG